MQCSLWNSRDNNKDGDNPCRALENGCEFGSVHDGCYKLLGTWNEHNMYAVGKDRKIYRVSYSHDEVSRSFAVKFLYQELIDNICEIKSINKNAALDWRKQGWGSYFATK